jgi:hypothetical protein
MWLPHKPSTQSATHTIQVLDASSSQLGTSKSVAATRPHLEHSLPGGSVAILDTWHVHGDLPTWGTLLREGVV